VKWVLLFIQITSPIDFDAEEMGRFDSMYSCFEARDDVLVALKAYDFDRPPINTQLVCVRTEYN